MKQVYPFQVTSLLAKFFPPVFFLFIILSTVELHAQSTNLRIHEPISGGEAQAGAGNHFKDPGRDKQGSDCSARVNRVSPGMVLKNTANPLATDAVEFQSDIDKKEDSSSAKQPVLKLEMSAWYAQDYVAAYLPAGWEGREVVLDIYTSEGRQIQKIIEHSAPAKVNIFLGAMPAGMYRIRACCQQESGIAQVVHVNAL